MESSTVVEPLVTDNPISHPSNTTKENSKREATLTPFAQVTNVPSVSTNRQNASGLTSQTGITQFHYDDHWQDIAIDFQRVNNHNNKTLFFYTIKF
jgi:hypothetical protein